MIKYNKKNQKGITLVTLSVAIIIMLIITATLIYNITTGAKVRGLNNMYKDVTKIKDKVDLYYASHRTIPILETKYENVIQLQGINPNDSNTYYVVDLEALENLNLTYGQDYKTYKENPSNQLTDIYIINERSHAIYYAKGISFENKMYYTMPEESTKVTTSSVLSVELIDNYENNASIKIYAVDKENGIKKITLMVNDAAIKTYEYTMDIREIKSEMTQALLTKEENTCYIQVEDEEGNTKNSDTITIKQTVRYVADLNGSKIPVPFGFSPITTSDQGTKKTGFVIKNDKDGNEFVWVPVKGMDYSYDRYAFSREDWTYSQTKLELDSATNSYKIIRADQTEYSYKEAMPSIGNRTELQSVNQYGGFYIGRYEVGVNDYSSLSTTSDGTKTWTGYSNGKAVVQKGKQVWNYITMDKAKEISESMYSDNDAVTSRLCSSYAWDTALKFIEKNYPEYPTKGSSTNYYGNYYDTTFQYIDVNRNAQTKAQNNSALVPTGQTTAVNNIYDMGGNVWEWTTEIYSNITYPCAVRGGFYGYGNSDFPAAFRILC